MGIGEADKDKILIFIKPHFTIEGSFS